MPVYSYKCSKCENKEERFFSMANAPSCKEKLKCEKCKKKQLRRIFDIPNIDDGPKSFGRQSEINLKKNPEMGKKKKLPVSNDPNTISPEKLERLKKVKDKEKYIMTGEMD